MIHVQEYLKTHSLAQLKEEHGIKSSAKPGEYMFSLNYDQIESKPNPMVNQCRGLILAMTGRQLQSEQVEGNEPVGETYVMARPFDRFFNFGDGQCASVDFEDPETMFFEKLDGTLCILYFNPELEEWHVATRAVPMADKPMTGWENMTFRSLFESALKDTLVSKNMVGVLTNPSVAFTTWCGNLNKGMTYMLELTTPMNRIVVEYKEFRVHLLGMRETESGIEHKVELIPDLFGVPICPWHRLNNQAEVMAFVGSKPPFEQEGIVIRDKHFNRVKVKSLAYGAYNRLRDSTADSPRAIMQLILTEKLDDVLPVLEGYVKPMAIKLQDNVRTLAKMIDGQYAEIIREVQGKPQERKEFALAVQARKAWMAPLINRYLGKNKDFSDFCLQNRHPDGSFSDGFLESLVEAANKVA